MYVPITHTFLNRRSVQGRCAPRHRLTLKKKKKCVCVLRDQDERVTSIYGEYVSGGENKCDYL